MLLDINFLKNNFKLIHFFGLGFVQIKLDSNLRMHFYHPDLSPIIHHEDIHNHRYDFISTIMAGNLTQEIFSVEKGDSDYYLIEENCNKDKLILADKMDVIVKPISIQHYKKGSSYTSLSTDFHKVSTDFAITRLYRGEILSENALVIRKKNIEPTCPFSKHLTEDQCWQVVDSCIHIANNQF